MALTSEIKRKKLLIYPGFQLSILVVNLIIAVVAALAIAFCVHRSFLNLRAQGVAAHLPPQNPYFAFMSYQENIVMGYLGIGLAVGSLLSSFAILYLSHRVAGPIVRLRGYLSDVEREPLAPREPLTFRKNDFFAELPDQVNGALKACAGASAGGAKAGTA